LSRSPRTSEILTAVAARPGERLTIADILGVLRDRAFALFVVLLGLPNCLPMPPPIPLICGFLLAFVALQIVLGLPAPWLPRALLRRSIARADLERAVARAAPVFRRLERVSRPRLAAFDHVVAVRLIGVLLLVFALGLLFAPPLIGQIPLGIAVCLVGLGLVERDGVMVLAGLAIGSFGLTLSFGFVYAIVAGLESLF
jgi:hypothetical protein